MARCSKPRVSCFRTESRPRPVTTNQRGLHPRLREVLERHRDNACQRPLPAHARTGLGELERALERHGGALVLDSGCGTGASTCALAQRHREALVVGIDKSAARLRVAAGRAERPANVMFLRLDVRDCWLEARRREWPVAAHYLFYPNPWPKRHHLMRRWHAHPLMPTLLAISERLELRTNWRLYAEEFAYSARFLGAAAGAVEAWRAEVPISAFEQKYADAGQALFRVLVGAAE